MLPAVEVRRHLKLLLVLRGHLNSHFGHVDAVWNFRSLGDGEIECFENVRPAQSKRLNSEVMSEQFK